VPVIVTARERPDLAERGRETSAVWPEYNVHSPISNRYWGRLLTDFPDHQFVLYDEAADEVVAMGHSVPLVWDGTVDGLPAGFDAILPAAFALLEAGTPGTTLCALAVQIPERSQGGGHSATMLGAMREIASRHALDALIAPVRPSLKESYPLVPIERYATWHRGLLGAERVDAPRRLVASSRSCKRPSPSRCSYPRSGERPRSSVASPVSRPRPAGPTACSWSRAPTTRPPTA
jgi:hypothetical protein